MKYRILVRWTTLVLMLFFHVAAHAQANDLMIVEYVDWKPGNGVGVTIFNPTSSTIDLSKYKLQIYNNGSTAAAGSYALSGNLAPGASIITGNDEYCNTYCKTCKFYNNSAGVNGNDVVALVKGSNFVDMVGLVGANIFWKVNGTSNALLEHKLTRNPDNCIRYTSTDGSSASSWPGNAAMDMQGWTVSGYSCLSGFFSLSGTIIVKPTKDTFVCKGATVTFSANGNTAWQMRDGSTTKYSSNSSISITFDKAGKDTIIAGSGACGDTVYVTVYSQPAPQIKGSKKINRCAESKDTIFIVQNIVGLPSWKLLGSHTGTVISSGTNKDTLKVKLGTKAGTDTFVVTDKAASCFGTDTLYLKINAVPVVSGFRDTTVCAGGSVQLNKSGGIYYRWTPSTGLDNASIANPVASPTNTTLYKVSVSDGACSATDSVKVNVHPLPKADAGTDQTMCAGDSVNLSAKGGISYEWSPVAGLNNPHIANPVAKPAAITSYIVKVANGQCYNYDTVQVNVKSKPKANAGTDAKICMGDSIQLNASGGQSYDWSPALGLSNPHIANPFAHPSTLAQYIVKVSDGFCYSYDTVMVNVKSRPKADAGSNDTICLGRSAALHAATADMYHWSTGETSQDIIVSPNATRIYTLTVTSGGCSSLSDTVQLFVLPQPVVSFSVSVAQGNAPLKVQFSNHSSNSVAYDWDFGDGEHDTTHNAEHTYSKAGSYTVKLTAWNSKGCESTSTFSTIEIAEPFSWFVPNVITPNGDDKNELFEVVGTGIHTLHGTIYNRWGEEVYTFNMPGGTWWDGTCKGDRVADGTYYYMLTATDATGMKYYKTGTLTIVR